jgi:polynucleotide 5'-hydroxyl-kinase GRC3/NOL9
MIANLNLTDNELIMPGDWMSIVQKIQSQDGTVMVLGKTDSGKTSFIKLLIHYLVRRNRKIGLIDVDIGQSTLGPPGTIGMCIVDKNRVEDGIVPIDYMLFIGAISPEQCIAIFLEKIYQLYIITQKIKVDALLIDTTGLVMGRIGVYLKNNLIKKVNPAILVALQSDKELEPILLEFEAQPSIKIYRIKPYQNIIAKNWKERKARRRRQFSIYFKDSQLRDIDFSAVEIKDFNFGFSLFLEKTMVSLYWKEFQLEIVSAEVINSRLFMILSKPQSITNKDVFARIKKHFQVKQIFVILPNWFQHLLVSFTNSEGLSNGLGIIKHIDFERKKITAYLPISISLDNLAKIELGRIRIIPDGSALPPIEPERY